MHSPNVIFLVKFKYKDNEISILNQTGTSFVGNINCKLNKTLQPIAFEISSISHITNLFRRRKSRFKIKTENENIKYFLEQSSSLNQLSKIAEKENFSPLITCELNDFWSIESNYHLEFDNWTQVVEPTIKLYKALIDEFEKRIANVSNGNYREMN